MIEAEDAAHVVRRDDAAMPYLRRIWYMAVWSHEVGRHLLRRGIIGEPILLYRGEDGSVSALTDRCPHRFAPLSAGTLEGDTVRCTYHGLALKGATAGHYSLKMQYGTDTEMSGTFEGVGTPEGIAFVRPDGTHVLRASTGEETGLKYLGGKTDCLMVKVGEGYCRN
jgi:hypothetical protein